MRLWVGSGASVRELLQAAIFFARGVDCDRRVFLAHVAFSQMIETEVGYDAVDPGVEGTFKAETSKILIGLEESLLIHVLRVRLRSGEVQRQPQNRLIVMTHEYFEGGAVSLLRLADQSRIVDAIALRCQRAPRIPIQRGVVVAFMSRPT